MNPHAKHQISVQAIVASFWGNRQLILQMTRREVVGRYQGSILGSAWSFFNPVVMLSVYTFVFSVIFKSRWPGGGDSLTEFAMVLFAGLIVFGIFSECVNRAPTLILANPNYVKRVIFPLEVQAWVMIGASLFHALMSLAVLLILFLIVNQSLPWTLVLFPAVLLPLILFTLGITWFLSSLGVFLRDVAQTVSLITTVLMFMTPVFYPVSALPQQYQEIIQLNPLSGIVEQSRGVLLWGQPPDWLTWLTSLAMGMVVTWAGFAWFQKTRSGFADVL